MNAAAVPVWMLGSVLALALGACIEHGRRPQFSIIDPDETCLHVYRGYIKGLPRRIAKDICGGEESTGAFMDTYGNCWIGPSCELVVNWEGFEPGEPWCWERAYGESGRPPLPRCEDIGVKIEF